MSDPINWQRLKEPFPPQDIEWKPGAITRDRKKGLAMAYITARAVQDRLDEVFGPAGWKNEFRAGPEGGVICRIYFKAHGGEWIWREDGADNTDVEAVKGGLSNALKRAGSALGIGRYLYDMPAQWVPLNDKGRFAEVPRIPSMYLPTNDRQTNGPPPRSREQAQQTVAQAAAEQEEESLTQADARELVEHGEQLGLGEQEVRDVIETFRVESGIVPRSAFPKIRGALDTLAVTGEVPDA